MGGGGVGEGGCQPEPLSVGSDQDSLEGESLIGSGWREELVGDGFFAAGHERPMMVGN